jgi:hypothetical protein
MKVIIYRALIVFVSIVAVPLAIGYANWDITIITRIGEWSRLDRVMLLIFTIASIAFGIIFSFTVEKK